MPRNAFGEPLLPELVREVAMRASLSDICRMAQVQHHWREALCEPGFVQTVWKDHVAWRAAPWLHEQRAQCAAAWRRDASWFLVLPLFETACGSAQALVHVTGNSPLLRELFTSASLYSVGTAEPLDDSGYWWLVMDCIEWACVRDMHKLMRRLYQQHVVKNSQFYEWREDYGERKHANFMRRLLDILVANESWLLICALAQEDSCFWPDGLDVLFFLLDTCVNLAQCTLPMDAIEALVADVADNDAPENNTWQEMQIRLAQHPEEAFLWERLLPYFEPDNDGEVLQ